MPDDLGQITGEMRGTVISGAFIELVLSQIPEQTWQWEEDWGFKGGLADIDTPMSKRREIVAQVLGVLTAAGVMTDG